MPFVPVKIKFVPDKTTPLKTGGADGPVTTTFSEFVLLASASLTTSETKFVRTTLKVCATLVAVVFVVKPSPKFQKRFVMRPVEVSVNVTDIGDAPAAKKQGEPQENSRMEMSFNLLQRRRIHKLAEMFDGGT